MKKTIIGVIYARVSGGNACHPTSTAVTTRTEGGKAICLPFFFLHSIRILLLFPASPRFTLTIPPPQELSQFVSKRGEGDGGGEEELLVGGGVGRLAGFGGGKEEKICVVSQELFFLLLFLSQLFFRISRERNSDQDLQTITIE